MCQHSLSLNNETHGHKKSELQKSSQKAGKKFYNNALNFLIKHCCGAVNHLVRRVGGGIERIRNLISRD